MPSLFLQAYIQIVCTTMLSIVIHPNCVCHVAIQRQTANLSEYFPAVLYYYCYLLIPELKCQFPSSPLPLITIYHLSSEGQFLSQLSRTSHGVPAVIVFTLCLTQTLDCSGKLGSGGAVPLLSFCCPSISYPLHPFHALPSFPLSISIPLTYPLHAAFNFHLPSPPNTLFFRGSGCHPLKIFQTCCGCYVSFQRTSSDH